MQPIVVIQCRFSSSRLPGKALYPLGGEPIIAFLIRRLVEADLESQIILATTDRPEDDPVAAWGHNEGVGVVRGETDDVLARYLRCLEEYPAPFAIRVTADNPLTAPEAIAQVTSAMQNNCWDYVSALEDYPYGAGVDAFSSGLIHTLHLRAETPAEREHINARVLSHKNRFRCLVCKAPPALARPDVRLTIDTPEDYRMISAIIGDRRAGGADFPHPWRMSLLHAIERSDQLHA